MTKPEIKVNFRGLIILSFYLACMLILKSIGVLARTEDDNSNARRGDHDWHHVVYQVEMFGKDEVSS